MRLLRESKYSLLGAGIAALLLGSSAMPVPANAQDSPAQGQRMPAGADSDAAARVKAALHSDRTFNAEHVDVSMDKGDVVLNGQVESSRAVLDATRIATKAAGSRKVVNNLTVIQNNPNAP